VGSLLALEQLDETEDIRIYINSTGGNKGATISLCFERTSYLSWVCSPLANQVVACLHAHMHAPLCSSDQPLTIHTCLHACMQNQHTQQMARPTVSMAACPAHTHAQLTAVSPPHLSWQPDRGIYTCSPNPFPPSIPSKTKKSEGGQPYSVFGILDTIHSIKPEVQTLALGACYSYSSLLLVRA
jgi:hypothetical protein